jgi:hypothetical protein
MSDYKKYLNVHEFETILPGSGEMVTYKPLTTAQIKKLLVYENEEDPVILEMALDDIITSSVITENFDVNNLLLQDRFFLLVEIRKNSKGRYYDFNITCPECGSQSLQKIDLNDLGVGVIEGDIEKWVEVNEFLSIQLDFIRRGHQRFAVEVVNSEGMNLAQRLAEMSLVATAAAMKAIKTPEGVDEKPSFEEKLDLLNNLSQLQFEKVGEWYEKNKFGVDFTYEMRCKHLVPPEKPGAPGKPCKFSQRVDIPVTNFFF